MSSGCRYLRVGPPSCDGTYADNVGKPYRDFQVIEAVLVAFLCLVIGYRSVRVFASKGVMGTSSHHKVLWAAILMAVTFVPRPVDPFSWDERLPMPFTQLIVDAASSFALCAAVVIIFDWFKVILKVSGGRSKLQFVGRLGLAIQVFVLLWFPTMGVLQVTVNEYYLFRGIKLLTGALVLLLLVALLAKYGSSVHSVLTKSHVSQSASSSLATTRDDGSPGMSTQRQESLRRRKHFADARLARINRIRTLMWMSGIVMMSGSLASVISGVGVLSDGYTLDDPGPPPSGWNDILAELPIEILQYFSVLIISYFFGGVVTSSDNSVSYRGGGTGDTPIARLRTLGGSGRAIATGQKSATTTNSLSTKL